MASIKFLMDGLPAGLVEFSLKASCNYGFTAQCLWTIARSLPQRLEKLALDFSFTDLADAARTTYSDERGTIAMDAHTALTRSTAHIADCVLDFTTLDDYSDYNDYDYSPNYSEHGDEVHDEP